MDLPNTILTFTKMYAYISVEYSIRHEIVENVLKFYNFFANSYNIYRLLGYTDFESIEILCLDFIHCTLSIIFI